MTIETCDVLVVGSGISGIAAAWHLRRECPGLKLTIIEGRQALGGTWDLFRYPGIRSDSDIYSFAYSFRPWRRAETIAGAPAILEYLRETADEAGISPLIQFGHRLVSADWDSAAAAWTVCIQRDGAAPLTLRCRFLFMCTGYYAYDEAHRPAFADEDAFAGPIVHPQFWPPALDYRDKRVVIIGSGATAVTLVPAMAGEAAHVTMLQRSPTYVVARPARDGLARHLRAVLPERMAYRLARLKFIARDSLFYQLARLLPRLTRVALLGLLRLELSGEQVARDFSPRYRPWDQRICLVPDGDLFEALRSGRASVHTGEIERFSAEGVVLCSGATLPADIIVTATGLRMELMRGVSLRVDGVPVLLGETLGYKGCMYSGVPNLASSFGYSNASWTLKAELVCHFVCRVLQHLEASGARTCVPVPRGVSPIAAGPMNLDSGYVARALSRLPKQGDRKPWQTLHNYLLDTLMLRRARVDDGELEFH